MKGRLTIQAIRQGISSWRTAYRYSPVAVEGRTYTRDQFEQLERYMSKEPSCTLLPLVWRTDTGSGPRTAAFRTSLCAGGRLTSMRRVLEHLRARLQGERWTQENTPAARKMVRSLLDGATTWVGDAPTNMSSPSASSAAASSAPHVAAQHASLCAGYAKLAASHAAQAVFHAQPQ